MSKRSGALLFSLLASLGACATVDTPRHGFATASVDEPSSSTAWGYAAPSPSPSPSPSEIHGYAKISEPQPATWGYAELPSQRAWGVQASR
ncbi:MAG TPA: hypothetical protein VHW23_01940 [Kofleriaceae bacterium]|nr:hypothetical protein [Kofleriaceae bacterium]